VFPEGCTILEEGPVSFYCGCSVDRVEAALKLLGVGEIRAAIDEDNDRQATLTCGFCHSQYTVSHARLRKLIAEVEAARTSAADDAGRNRDVCEPAPGAREPENNDD